MYKCFKEISGSPFLISVTIFFSSSLFLLSSIHCYMYIILHIVLYYILYCIIYYILYYILYIVYAPSRIVFSVVK